MWRNPSGIAYHYDEKIISETSVAWTIHLAIITQRLAARQCGVLSGILGGPLNRERLQHFCGTRRRK